QMASIDFFTVPTATFRVLFVFVVLSHERRRVVHFQVTEHPTQEWTMQQMREAFPWDQVPRYLGRDRDAIYGQDFSVMTKGCFCEYSLLSGSCEPKAHSSHRDRSSSCLQTPHLRPRICDSEHSGFAASR